MRLRKDAATMDSAKSKAPSQTVLPPNHDEFLTYSQLPEPPADEWLIDGILQAQSFAVLYGPAGCGKTFLSLGMGLSVATGTPWLGRQAKRGTVFYIAAEDAARTKRRVDGWLHDRNLPPPTNMFYRLSAPDFTNEEAMKTFCDNVKRASDEQGAAALIIVDNLGRVMALLGAGDSETGITGKVMDCLDKVKTKTGSGIILDHHTNKMGEAERGSTTIRAVPDCMLFAKNGVLRCTKQRSEAEFAPVGFALRRVVLPDGHSTCVPELVGTSSDKEWTANQQLILGALKDCPSGKKFSVLWKNTGLAKATFADVLKGLSKGEKSEISFSDGLYSLRPKALDGEGRSGKPPLGGFPTDRPTVVEVEPEKNLRTDSDRTNEGRTELGRPDQPPTDQWDEDFDPDEHFSDDSDDDAPLDEPPDDLPEVEVDSEGYEDAPTPEEMMEPIVWNRRNDADDHDRDGSEVVAKVAVADDEGF